MCLGVPDLKKTKKSKEKKAGGVQYGKKKKHRMENFRLRLEFGSVISNIKTRSLKGKHQAILATQMPKNSTNYGLRFWRC